jgi:hypothetical protein
MGVRAAARHRLRKIRVAAKGGAFI